MHCQIVISSGIYDIGATDLPTGNCRGAWIFQAAKYSYVKAEELQCHQQKDRVLDCFMKLKGSWHTIEIGDEMSISFSRSGIHNYCKLDIWKDPKRM